MSKMTDQEIEALAAKFESHDNDGSAYLQVVDFARAILAEAVPKWLPIESAPKDGTAILLCWAIDADGKPIDWAKNLKTAGVFVQAASWWGEDEEWIVYCSMSSEPRLHFNPTHWMPLPAAPSAEGE